jgi:hypothetical protein
MPNRLRKLARLSPRALLDLLAAQAALLAAEWRMRTKPIGSLTVRDSSAGTPPPASAHNRQRAIELATAVRRAADFGLFRPFCLVRAMALRTLLERADIHGSEIRIGVRRRDGIFAAHAWIRWNNQVLGDLPAHVATFTEVDDIRVLGRS